MYEEDFLLEKLQQFRHRFIKVVYLLMFLTAA